MKTAVRSRSALHLPDRKSDFLATFGTERSLQFARPDFQRSLVTICPVKLDQPTGNRRRGDQDDALARSEGVEGLHVDGGRGQEPDPGQACQPE